MANRNKNFDEMLAKEMEDFEFARGYLLAQIDEHGEPVQDAVIASIEAMGLACFAKKYGFSMQSVSDFVNKKRSCKVATIDKFLKPFGLKVKLDVEKVA